MKTIKFQTRIALACFFLATLMGVLLRAFPLADPGFTYRYMVHGHSHIALLGWVYLALTTLMCLLFLPEKKLNAAFRKISGVTWLSLAGMLVTFPLVGYRPVSIVFSTLFILVSYVFAWFFIKHTPKALRQRNSWKCLRAGLFYMMLSSLGPWSLGIIMNTLGSTSVWYKTAVYFYLHFQYNGWFITALCGFLFYILETGGIKIPKSRFRLFYRLLNGGIILSFFLSVLWTGPYTSFHVLGLTGGLLQAAAFILLCNMLRNRKGRPKPGNRLSGRVLFLFRFSGVLLAVKLLLQYLSGMPVLSDVVYRITEFVIGYLHLTFLGVISTALLGLLLHFRLIRIPAVAMPIYLLAFLVTEGLIFYKAVALWQNWPVPGHYYLLLLAGSFLFPVATGILLLNNRKSPWHYR
ncbi:hypothetical protein [Sinomicrobium soli]|uniref:hypothetical protein n=1 Tax=Sinomicrobium sp. N-1-3-6 TaxID=2219864 RepID=UPI000DCCBF35|nr:hypothetical protein [Sinomicrobium sp. N-1-3-6]RAV30031.1 hypothetical protein DN748_04310 [Sinomicrobium sp. N-1-3-6]